MSASNPLLTVPQYIKENIFTWSNLFYMMLAFVLWGGWTFYVHNDYAFWIKFRSAVAQGSISSLGTLVITVLTEMLFFNIRQRTLQWILPAIIPMCISTTLSAIVHHLIGTPLIVKTLIPTAIVAFSFCLLITVQLKREQAVALANIAG